MKILFISFSNLPSLQYYLYNTYKTIKLTGNEISTIGSSNISINIELDKNNILMMTPDQPRIGTDTFIYLFQALRLFRKTILNTRPDVIHFISKHTWNIFFIILLKILGNHKIKIVHTIHDPIGHEGEKIKYLVKMYNKIIVRMIDGIVVHSKNSYFQLRNNYKLNKSVAIVPLGEATWNEFQKPCNTKQVLVFGRLNSYKGCNLIPTISDFLLRYDPEIKLVVAGRASSEIQKDLIDEIGNKPNVDLINRYISDSESDTFYINSDLVLITHLHISQSGVIVQAYKNSRPVVAFDIEGMNEFVINNITGSLIPTFDLEKYTLKIATIVNDNALLQSMSKNAWEIGQHMFDTSKMCNGFLSLYDLIINNKVGVINEVVDYSGQLLET